MHNKLILFQILLKSVKYLFSHWTPEDMLSLKIYCKIYRVSRSGIGCRLQIPCVLGLPQGKQHSPHSTFLMGCNQECICFKPISELPAWNPNSFLKQFLLNLNIKYILFCQQQYLSFFLMRFQHSVRRQTVCLCCLREKGNKSHGTFSFPFTTFSSPFFFFF